MCMTAMRKWEACLNTKLSLDLWMQVGRGITWLTRPTLRAAASLYIKGRNLWALPTAAAYPENDEHRGRTETGTQTTSLPSHPQATSLSLWPHLGLKNRPSLFTQWMSGINVITNGKKNSCSSIFALGHLTRLFPSPPAGSSLLLFTCTPSALSLAWHFLFICILSPTFRLMLVCLHSSMP